MDTLIEELVDIQQELISEVPEVVLWSQWYLTLAGASSGSLGLLCHCQ